MTEKNLPASIRNRNPGAMWPGPSATKFGSKATAQLTDAQRNNMAVFPSHVQGAAAQFDLLLRLYCGKPLRDAIGMWSGENSVPAYLAVIKKETGLKGTDVLRTAYIEDPATAIPFAKAMAKHEAGRDKHGEYYKYPMSEDEWHEAHSMALDAKATVPPHLELLLSWYEQGVKEVPGKAGSNPIIDEMFLICGHPKWKFKDDTAWCAVAFYASVILTGGYAPPPTKNTMARSVLRWGLPVKLDDIRPGDARVEARGSDPTYGHVDTVISVDYRKGTVEVIGGNVDNKFTRRTKSIKGALGYRRREDAPKPVAVAVKESPSIMMLVRSAFVGVCAYVADLIHDVPDIAAETTEKVNATRSLTEAIGVTPTAAFFVGLAVVVAAAAVYRMIDNRREDA